MTSGRDRSREPRAVAGATDPPATVLSLRSDGEFPLSRSSGAVDVTAVIYPDDDHGTDAVVDAVYGAVRTASRRGVSGQLPLKRLADPMRVNRERAGDELDTRTNDLRQRSWVRSTSLISSEK